MSFEIDNFTQKATDNAILGLQSASSQSINQQLPNDETKRKIRSIKVDIDTLKSSKIGLPVLFKQLSKFKFQKRTNKASKYASHHHLQNLQGILEIYQSWYHTLNPRLKFESMIHNMNSSLGDSEPRRFLEGVILSDRQRRRDRLERRYNSQPEQQQPDDSILVSRPSSHADDDDEEIWPEMFGGEPEQLPEQEQISEPVNEEDAFSDDDLYDNDEVRQMVSFSTILATSSQMPVSTQPKGPSDPTEGAGFDGFLSDDENALEEAQNGDEEDVTNLNFM